MARYETILIAAESTLDHIASQVAAAVGGDATAGTDPSGEARWAIRLPSGAVGWVAAADYEDDRGMPLSGYRFEVDVGDPNRDVARQEMAARDLYERLVEATEWSLLLTFNDLQQRIAGREAKPATSQRL